jgi:hypothetical protein
MPSKSKAQHNFMAAVANNPSFAKKVGVPQSVGKDFSNADKGKTFKRGGDMPIKAKAQSLDEMKKDAISSSVAERGYKKGGSVKASSMGKVKTAAPSKDGVAVKGKTKGTQIKMAGSGVPGGIGSRVMKNGGMAKAKC